MCVRYFLACMKYTGHDDIKAKTCRTNLNIDTHAQIVFLSSILPPFETKTIFDDNLLCSYNPS